MAKIEATADAIRQEIHRRIETSKELPVECKKFGAPTPVLLREPDANGCNWTVTSAPSYVPGCIGQIYEITRSVMAEYNLIE